MLELVKTLCAMHGVSGWEDEVREAVRERIMPFADEIREDAMGNLMILKKGTHPGGHTLMLCAHMDEVGFIVKGFTDEGYLTFARVGGIDPTLLPGRRVLVGLAKHPGVITTIPKHLLSKDEMQKVTPPDKLLIDIGASSREEAEARVSPGDPCAFWDSPAQMGDGYLRARALDDRAGCALLVHLAEKHRPRHDTWFVFTVQEELGMRGAFGPSFAIAPTLALVLETTTAADRPDMEPHRQVCRPGAGVVLPVMDNGSIYDPTLRARLIELAEANGIPWQNKELLAGGTDGAAVQRSRAGVMTAGMAIAVRYLHSPVSVAYEQDIIDMYRLLLAFMESME